MTRWLRNTLRNRIRRTWLGRQAFARTAWPPRGVLRVVSATRLAPDAFWAESALGRSLAPLRGDPGVRIEIAFANTQGLPALFNRQLDAAARDEAIVFVHDDVWIDDEQWRDKLGMALSRFDLVGLVGNRRRVPGQPTWKFVPGRQDYVSDDAWLAGVVRHGPLPGGVQTVFGPTPAACELLDGLFLAVRGDVARDSGLRFDERFDFHFYDMDLCRSARQAGLSVGTWPIDVTHQSMGMHAIEGWQRALAVYMDKWKS